MVDKNRYDMGTMRNGGNWSRAYPNGTSKEGRTLDLSVSLEDTGLGGKGGERGGQ